MKEKILALLKTKFTGVDEATLSRIAEKKATGVTDESQLQTIADGVSFQDVLNSYGDFRANGAVASAVTNYEKKHGLKDGKPIETATTTTAQQRAAEQHPDMAKLIADAVKAAVEPLSTELAGFKQAKAQEERNSQILAKAKEYGIPESQAKRYAIPEDADLDAYFKDAKQELVDAGFQTLFTDPGIVKAVIDRVLQQKLDAIYWKQYGDFLETKTRVFKTYLGTVTGVVAGSILGKNDQKPLRERRNLGSGYTEIAYLGDRYQMDMQYLKYSESLCNIIHVDNN